MSNLRTLKPFKKGYDPRRNTKGRPVGSRSKKTLAEMVTEMGNKIVPGTNGMTYQQLFVRALFKKGMEGNIKAIELMANISEGKPRPVKMGYYDGEIPDGPRPILGDKPWQSLPK
jgi:hypothetical protein